MILVDCYFYQKLYPRATRCTSDMGPGCVKTRELADGAECFSQPCSERRQHASHAIDGSKVPVWFAVDESRPLLCFAGLWTNWTSVRKAKEGEITADIFAMLTTAPNAEVGRVHPKAMPVILTTEEERDVWMRAPWGRGRQAAAPATGRRAQDRCDGGEGGCGGGGLKSS